MNITQLVMTVFVLQLIINGATAWVLLTRIKRYDTNIDSTVQQAITDVAEQIGENIEAAFAKPATSRAMSILGQKSGVVRADKATLNKFSENLPDLIPSLGFLAERLDMEPVEMLKLVNDPIVGPMIQNVLGGILPQSPSGGPKNPAGLMT